MSIRSALLAGLVCGAFLAAPGQSQDVPWLEGFSKRLDGEILGYHSAIKGVNESLLVRSLDSLKFIEWETSPVPYNVSGESATFAWLANYDSTRDARSFNLFVNSEKWFTFTNSHDRDWTLDAPNGAKLRFHTVQLDRHGDYNGYHFLTVPSRLLEPGMPLTLRVTGESAGERTWYMILMYGIRPSVEVLGENALFHGEDGPTQRVRVDVVHHGEPVPVGIEIPGVANLTGEATLGRNSFYINAPAVSEDTAMEVLVTVGAAEPERHPVLLKPVRHFDVYFLPHSHLDIGYTDLQDRVLLKQWQNIEEAIRLARATDDYPDGARYRWNVEGFWVVDEYLRKAPHDRREAFLDAVRRGWLGIEGLYADNMTGLMREEELFRYAGENFRPLMDEYGLAPESVMITDVPGYSWGLVPALLHNGIRYFSSGPNYIPGLPHGGDRIGYTLEAWGDDPFYWEAPSGKGRVLFWMSSKGYSWFHGLVNQSILNTDTQPILDYLKSLADNDYRYDMVYLRYTIGGDNGPPDPGMPDFVKQWNEKHVSPKLRIATTTEVFRIFEEKYGDRLPVRRGDFSPYWEDGAASTARETALARNAAERLVQAEIAWSILNPSEFPVGDFEEAWRNVLLFNEHTWGAWNSIDQPEDPDVIAQWKIKQQMALDADRQSHALLQRGLARETATDVVAVEVINTSSWSRTDLVRLPGSWKLAGESITGPGGNPVPTQRLADGTLVFVARNVPALGSAIYSLEKGRAPGPVFRPVPGLVELANNTVHLTVNEFGEIDDLSDLASGANIVDRSADSGLNHYVYTGLNAADPRSSSLARLTLEDDGPVVTTLLAESDAPGTNGLRRRVQLVNGLARVHIHNTIDKTDIREKENVRFGFPFQISDGEMTLDLAWTTMEPERDQLTGSNKNYFIPQRSVNISNDRIGLTFVSVDAPLVEIGGMLGEAWMNEQHRPWVRTHRPSQLLYSWVMNNSWHTNFKASQSGVAEFRYDIHVHGSLSDAEIKRLGIDSNQPLLVRPAQPDALPRESLFSIPDSSSIMITSIRPESAGDSYVVRLYNSGHVEETAWTAASFPVDGVKARHGRREFSVDAAGGLPLQPREISTLVYDRPSDSSSGQRQR